MKVNINYKDSGPEKLEFVKLDHGTIINLGGRYLPF